MPSPGANAIAAIIGGKSYSVEGNYTTTFTSSGEFVSKLADAIHAGWTSSSPVTGTNMIGSFNTAFSGFLTGIGLLFINSIAQGIDEEITAWTNSWNGTSHSFTVSADSIVSRIIAIAPINSNGVLALTEVIAEAFMSGFGQETG